MIDRLLIRGSLGSQNVGSLERSLTMLNWAVTFFIIAIIAALLGFSGIAGAASGIAQVLFLVFLVLFIITLIVRAMGGRGPSL